ncbi:MAG TPA: sigma 54-interacting transcriptional regulator [Polyangiaceae bacterium]
MPSKAPPPSELEDETTLREEPEVAGKLSLLVSAPKGVTLVPLEAASDITIGRSAECDVVIDDRSVSRKHARLSLGSTVHLEDLGSRNGTIVQQRRIEPGHPTRVGIGWVFEIGDATLLLQRTRDLPRQPPAPPASASASAKSPASVVVDAAMQRLYAMLEVVAPTSLSVLILGETGVGKELFAEAIHRCSTRSAEPFLHLNCAALPDSILEGELFGYEKGAFTGATQAKAGLFEAADRGTVFLDEIGELPLATQAKLLRVLESGEVLRLGSVKPITVDVRFVSATNRDLRKLTGAGSFRSDLYFRVNGIALTLPPLRKRKADIVPLARHFVARAAVRSGKPSPDLSAATLHALEAHAWTGNVRELRNVVERAVALCGRGPIEVQHLMLADAPGLEEDTGDAPAPLHDEMESLYKRRIVDALDATKGNQSQAAKLLGISRRTLITKMEQYGLERPRKGRSL